MLMVRVLHDAFIIVEMMSLVKPTALSNSKQKLMIVPVRFVRNHAIFIMDFLFKNRHFRPIANQDVRVTPLNVII